MMKTSRTFCLALAFLFSISLFSQSIIFVNAGVAGGNNDGTSWANAFPGLQAALAVAQAGEEIWVAQGTYLPTADSDRHASFILKNGVRLYGGFDGTETERSQRNWTDHPAILSGDIAVPGDSTDNSYTVVYAEDVDSTAVLDGFVVTRGMADETASGVPNVSVTRSGGGMYVFGKTLPTCPVVQNCTFSGSYADNGGGAVFIHSNSGVAVFPQIRYCKFEANTTKGLGGALNKNGGSFAPAFDGIRNCHFTGNFSQKTGSAIYISDHFGDAGFRVEDCIYSENVTHSVGTIFYYDFNVSVKSLNVTRCLFSGNMAGGGSGIGMQSLFETVQGVIIQDNVFESNTSDNGGTSSPDDGGALFADVTFMAEKGIRIENCKFEKNHSDNGGAIRVFAINGSVEVRNSEFIENQAQGSGGAIYIGGAKLTVHSSRFTGNTAGEFGGAIYAYDMDTLTNTIFAGNSAKYAGAIAAPNYQINKSIVLNCVFFNNLATFAGGALHIKNPTLVNSIFWGNTAPEGDIFMPSSAANLRNCLLDISSCAAIDDKVFIPNSFQTGTFLCNSSTLFNENPLFTDPLAGDFSLLPCSPAANAGDNNAVTQAGLLTDLDGNPRIIAAAVDLGPLESPAMSVDSVIVAAAACGGGATGAVEFQISNACEPLTYLWYDGFSTGVGTSGLHPGDYQFFITDATGAEVQAQVEILAAPPVSATATATAYACNNGTGGTATATASGGTSPFSFEWENGSNDPTAGNLFPGTYAVTATDANGCTAIAQATVPATGNLALTLSVTPISCHDSHDGTATVQPLAGLPPFNWLWTGGQTTATLDSIAGGNYAVAVTDAAGCTGQLSFTINPPSALALQIAGTDVACAGDENGSATVTATGGTPGYTYLWSNQQATKTAVNLAPGWHTVTVTDVRSCSDTSGILIEAPSALSLEVDAPARLCPGGVDTVWAMGGGGVPPYTFDWGNGQADPVLAVVSGGFFQVEMTDSNGCQAVQNFEIEDVAPVAIDFTIENATTVAAEDGALILNGLTGGAPPFQFQWSTGETTESIENLLPGSYQLTVTDSAGCAHEFLFTVEVEVSARQVWGDDFEVKILPNLLASGQLVDVYFKSSRAQVLQLNLLDETGRVFQSELLNLQVGELFHKIWSPVVPGFYLLVFENENGGKAVLPFVVI